MSSRMFKSLVGIEKDIVPLDDAAPSAAKVRRPLPQPKPKVALAVVGRCGRSPDVFVLKSKILKIVRECKSLVFKHFRIANLSHNPWARKSAQALQSRFPEL
jgi:hypothetical protein